MSALKKYCWRSESLSPRKGGIGRLLDRPQPVWELIKAIFWGNPLQTKNFKEIDSPLMAVEESTEDIEVHKVYWVTVRSVYQTVGLLNSSKAAHDCVFPCPCGWKFIQINSFHKMTGSQNDDFTEERHLLGLNHYYCLTTKMYEQARLTSTQWIIPSHKFTSTRYQ